MPILVIALLALSVFLVIGFLFFSAMEAEHRQREKEAKQAEVDKQQAKAVAQSAGR